MTEAHPGTSTLDAWKRERARELETWKNPVAIADIDGPMRRALLSSSEPVRSGDYERGWQDAVTLMLKMLREGMIVPASPSGKEG